jgi:heterodisulfide reductase subunit A
VDLVEQNEDLGGNGRYFSPGPEKDRLEKLIISVQTHPKIRVHFSSNLISHTGLAGAFTATIARHENDRIVKHSMFHGSLILATGGKEADTTDYCATRNPGIISVFELENRLREKTLDPMTLSRIVMIQCAGSREEPRNYCSRVCCVKALTNAIRIRELNPDAKIHIFYRDMMSYGESEKIYTMARKAGVLFIPFDKGQKPLVTVTDGNVSVTGFDPVMQEEIKLEPMLLVLSTGLVPSNHQDLSRITHTNTTQDGFLKEANSKWRPVDSGREGIFVCGLARAPLRAFEAMDEGISAAVRALRILCKDSLPVSQITARVRHSLCSRCEACIPECPYQARYMDMESGRIMVDTASCQGCGACASLCPNSSILMGSFEEKGIMDSIELFLNT